MPLVQDRLLTRIEMNFVMTPLVEDRSLKAIDQQSSALLLCYGCPEFGKVHSGTDENIQLQATLLKRRREVIH